ncbi:hypothetical protein HNY73_006687 [Argiope bruennichi]|uniref:Uncharacterized protein n=1 Tax=Argiope bruennichi TaxID=94029 RepID=A0A8T0FCM6_ARGBR|nr:hypothetical protein HNY73_006687 [Argiope bruennichi]
MPPSRTPSLTEEESEEKYGLAEQDIVSWNISGNNYHKPAPLPYLQGRELNDKLGSVCGTFQWRLFRGIRGEISTSLRVFRDSISKQEALSVFKKNNVLNTCTFNFLHQKVHRSAISDQELGGVGENPPEVHSEFASQFWPLYPVGGHVSLLPESLPADPRTRGITGRGFRQPGSRLLRRTRGPVLQRSVAESRQSCEFGDGSLSTCFAGITTEAFCPPK